MLAARAYLKASYVVDDSTVSSAYHKKAQQAIALQFSRDLSEIEADLKSEIGQGDRLFRQISDDERAWIASGLNLDSEFNGKYYKLPALNLNQPHWKPTGPVTMASRILLGGLAILLMAIVLIVAITIRKAGRKRSAPAK